MRKLSIVGIGAGDYDGMTIGAVNALNESEVIVGYTVYCDLIRPYFKDKVFVSTPMTTETERCHLALESAREGKTTSMICSGDAGFLISNRLQARGAKAEGCADAPARRGPPPRR